jgi:hypothetical protein
VRGEGRRVDWRNIDLPTKRATGERYLDKLNNNESSGTRSEISHDVITTYKIIPERFVFPRF